MKASRSFVVSPTVPHELADLTRLASNLRWSWHKPTRAIFEELEPDAWDRSKGSPLDALGQVRQSRLAEVAADPAFLNTLRGAVADLDDAVNGERWFQIAKHDSPLRQVAYFSPEFGVTEVIQQYSGGLGILAGDHLKSVSDLGVPLVGVGLFYRNGYFHQGLTSDGWQQEQFPEQEPLALGLTDTGVTVTVDLAGETCTAKVWRADVGRTALYLLDTDTDANPKPELRYVTDRLYGGDSEHRLRQEIVLGIGGVRALRALGIDAQVFHTNEGHAGFLAFERIRLAIESGLSWVEAVEMTRAGTLFTTHTPVPAGIDRFHIDLIRKYFATFAQHCGVTFEQLFSLGQTPHEEADRFNMAVMGLRLSGRANGVAALHGVVSRSMFNPLWPDLDATEVPITSVTNGVHAHTWVADSVARLFETTVSPVWDGASDAEWSRAQWIPTASIVSARRQGREALIEEVNRRTTRGAGLSPDALTIGFARRFATYKRATLLLSQPERLARLLGNTERPVQFIFAGKAHPADDEGKRLIQDLNRFALRPEAAGRMVFVEDYDMALARALYHGCDVWLNTPRRPHEACGTSGMKAALNGALNCSIRDGWWDEWFDGENGWAITDHSEITDLAVRDRLEADALFTLLETAIVPTFHDEPERWWRKVRHNWVTLGPKVTASRMVREYTERLYEPSAVQADRLTHDHGSAARTLAGWKAHVRTVWPSVHLHSVEVDLSATAINQNRTVRARLDLGALSPADVQVDVVHGRIDGRDEFVEGETVTPLVLHDDGWWSGTLTTHSTGRYGVVVRARPVHPLLTSPEDLGLERRS